MESRLWEPSGRDGGHSPLAAKWQLTEAERKTGLTPAMWLAKMKLGSSHRGSVCLQTSDETWQFFLSCRRPSSRLPFISLVTATGYHLHSNKKKKKSIAFLIEGLTYDVGWNDRVKLIYHEAISAHLSLNIPRRWFLLWHRPFTLHLLVLNDKMLSLWMTSEEYLPMWVCAHVVGLPCSKRYKTALIFNFCNVYVTFKIVGA